MIHLQTLHLLPKYLRRNFYYVVIFDSGYILSSCGMMPVESIASLINKNTKEKNAAANIPLNTLKTPIGMYKYWESALLFML